MKWFHRHHWSRWESYAKTNIIQPITGGVLGYIFIQKRTCYKCGLVQYQQDRIMAEDE